MFYRKHLTWIYYKYWMQYLFSAFEQIDSQSVFVFYLSKFSICGFYAPQMQTSMLKKLSSFDSITRKNRLMLKAKSVFDVCNKSA